MAQAARLAQDRSYDTYVAEAGAYDYASRATTTGVAENPAASATTGKIKMVSSRCAHDETTRGIARR